MKTPGRADTTWRATLGALAIAASTLVPCTASLAAAQANQKSLIQIEVRDSIGLPLPDAAIEVFTFLDGGVFWEWARVDAADIPQGINLLRFSHDGYQPAIFSVPLQEGGTVSLRVNLHPERDTVTHRGAVVAHDVHAIGLAFGGHAKTDIIGRRRIIDSRAIDHETNTSFGGLLRRARNTELSVLPASGGTFLVYGQSGPGKCVMSVMVNGDRRRVLPFETFDRMFGTADVEAIEVFPRSTSLPFPYQVPNARCGMMVVWFKVP
jgi:hypothetical protein